MHERGDLSTTIVKRLKEISTNVDILMYFSKKELERDLHKCGDPFLAYTDADLWYYYYDDMFRSICADRPNLKSTCPFGQVVSIFG